MAWEVRGSRRYFYRSVREGDRVRRKYMGTGIFAAFAEIELMESKHRRAIAQAESILLAQTDTAFAAIRRLSKSAVVLQMLESGYIRKNGRWKLFTEENRDD